MTTIRGVALGTYYAAGAHAAKATPNASAMRGLVYAVKDNRDPPNPKQLVAHPSHPSPHPVAVDRPRSRQRPSRPHAFARFGCVARWKEWGWGRSPCWRCSASPWLQRPAAHGARPRRSFGASYGPRCRFRGPMSSSWSMTTCRAGTASLRSTICLAAYARPRRSQWRCGRPGVQGRLEAKAFHDRLRRDRAIAPGHANARSCAIASMRRGDAVQVASERAEARCPVRGRRAGLAITRTRSRRRVAGCATQAARAGYLEFTPAPAWTGPTRAPAWQAANPNATKHAMITLRNMVITSDSLWQVSVQTPGQSDLGARGAFMSGQAPRARRGSRGLRRGSGSRCQTSRDAWADRAVTGGGLVLRWARARGVR